MRCLLFLLPLSTLTARAAGWSDVPALVSSAMAPVDAELRACSKRLPRSIAVIASRNAKTGKTDVTLPIYGVGGRGLTAEEKCLTAAVAKVSMPDLPATIDRVIVGHTVYADGVKPPPDDAAFDDWRDPAATLAHVVDAKALAACSAKPRTVRIIFDLTAGKTRVWLPAWQFHSPSGDGSTPPAEQKVKACLDKAIATFKPPVLPKAMGELEAAVTP